MTYIPHTDGERAAMLAAIGVDRLEDLFEAIPAQRRFPALDLPAPLSEAELEQEMAALAARNSIRDADASFLGAGVYRHYRPATVDYVLQRGEFYTAYTPYQPEASQGMLQAMFEYQSMICALTAMEVCNASHYDGATALAEAVLLALTVATGKRDRVIVSPVLHPQYRAVLRTYLSGSGATLSDTASFALHPDIDALKAQLDEHTAALVIQNPNFCGQFEDITGLAEAVHRVGALLIVVPDPIALGLFQPPGSYGADIVAAEGQPLGIAASFGGPHLGIFAARQALLRRMPGRLVGETVDDQGRRGYVLTLSSREQHIRRERATSNICTNAALSALAATVYLATLGKTGLRQVARLCYQKSHYAAERIGRLRGFRINPQAPRTPFFKEFVVAAPRPVAEINAFLAREYGITGGYDLGREDPALADHMLIALTELNTRRGIDRLVEALQHAAA
jgi:glycine dehydrogenase subunit 1